jgi:nitronate monooxygenase
MLLPSRLPIIQAPMAGGPSTPELAAAVAEAGGFGYVAGGYLTVDALQDALRRTRELTAGPIGLNLFVPYAEDTDDAAIAAYAADLRPEAERLGVQLGDPTWDDDEYPAKLEFAARAGVHTVSFTFGCPAPNAVADLHRAGCQVAVTVTDLPQAEAAADAGSDALIVQGTEAGGHQGGAPTPAPNRTTLFDALVTIRHVGLPMIGTGGIATPDAVVSALDAGAFAVQIGTALLCTPEAGTNDLHRAALMDQRYAETAVTRAYSGRWARGLANRFAREHADAPAGYPQIHHLTRPLRAAAVRSGDADLPNLWAGTGWRWARAEPAAKVIARLAAQL